MSYVEVEAEKKLIDQVVQGLVEADISKDLDRIMDLFAEDVIYQPQGVPSLIGADAVREYLRERIHRLEDLKAGPYRVEVSESGDLAYSIGWIKAKNYGMEDYVDRKYFIVCRKIGEDWKIVAESFSSNS